MPLNSASPIIGRPLSAGLGFLSSVAGLPVAGSLGLLSQTMTPQMPPPHLLTRTLASPFWVSQIPLTSPPGSARAGGGASAAEAATARAKLQAIHLDEINLGDFNLRAAKSNAMRYSR